MSKTLKILADRKHQIDSLVAAGEQLEMRFADNRKCLSLRAQKLLHLLVNQVADGVGERNMGFVIQLSDITRHLHLTKNELETVTTELVQTAIILRKKNKRGQETAIGSILSYARIHEPQLSVDDDHWWATHETPMSANIDYSFSPVFIEVMRSSNHWAILSRRAVLAFQSRYSLRLYELVSLRVGREHHHAEDFEIDDLRSIFGVPEGKLLRWADLRVKVIEPAIAELNQLTGVSVEYRPIKRGRGVGAVKLIWHVKEQAERDAAAAELDRSSVGRKARREGTVETIDAILSGAEVNDPTMAAALRRMGEALADNWKTDLPSQKGSQ